MLKVEVQYVDFGNIEALPLASLREPTRAISHVNSLPFQVIHPTCLFVPCSLPPPPPHSLPFQILHSTCLFVSPPITLSPFSYPTPMSYCVFLLLLSSLTGTPLYLSSPPPPSFSLLTSTPLHLLSSLPPLLSSLTRYPSLIVFLFPTSLCSL